MRAFVVRTSLARWLRLSGLRKPTRCRAEEPVGHTPSECYGCGRQTSITAGTAMHANQGLSADGVVPERRERHLMIDTFKRHVGDGNCQRHSTLGLNYRTA